MSSRRMSASALDRNTAATLNPLIGINTIETLDRCRSVMSDLGYLVSAAVQRGCTPQVEDYFRIHEVIAAAIAYETDLLEHSEAEDGGAK